MIVSKHPLFWVWVGMMGRCYRPNHVSYKNYGARGITVCVRWRTFENFAADMTGTYEKGLTLERKNNARGYTKQNCGWVTRGQQARNTRANRMVITPWGKMCFQDACRKAGLSYNALNVRMKRWPKRLWFLPVNSTARYARK